MRIPERNREDLVVGVELEAFPRSVSDPHRQIAVGLKQLVILTRGTFLLWDGPSTGLGCRDFRAYPQFWSLGSVSSGGRSDLRCSISFFSSIILSSRPTTIRWNCSSSASRSSALACCWAIVRWAWFWLVTSRAAANTPRTLPPASRYTEALYSTSVSVSCPSWW